MDLDRLRKHYASLSDEALLEIDREELVPAACEVLDAEIAERGLLEPQEAEGAVEFEVSSREYEDDWAESAATVFTSVVQGGVASRIAVGPQQMEDDAQRVMQALQTAGIPFEVTPRQEQGRPLEMDINVPGKVLLEATSILDRDVFNEQLEQGWREHFAALSNDELAAIDIRVLTAGWADRIERLTRAYKDERAQRS